MHSDNKPAPTSARLTAHEARPLRKADSASKHSFIYISGVLQKVIFLTTFIVDNSYGISAIF